MTDVPPYSQATSASSTRTYRGVLANWVQCLHYVSMPNILVRDIPESVHAELQRRAERSGQSLQQYLSRELGRLVARPDLDELLDRIENERQGGRVDLERAAADLAEERHRT